MSHTPPEAQIITLTNISHLAPHPKNKKTVLVGGCFDVLHFGHVTFLAASRAAGDALIVALEPDEFILRKKGKKPMHTQKERAQVLAALRAVDTVVLLPYFDKDAQYLQMTASIRPDLIAITEGDPNKHKKQLHAQAVGADLLVVTPHLKDFSSSKASSS